MVPSSGCVNGAIHKFNLVEYGAVVVVSPVGFGRIDAYIYRAVPRASFAQYDARNFSHCGSRAVAARLSCLDAEKFLEASADLFLWRPDCVCLMSIAIIYLLRFALRPHSASCLVYCRTGVAAFASVHPRRSVPGLLLLVGAAATAAVDDDLDDFLNSLTDDAGPAAPTGGSDANVNIEDLDKALG